MDCYTVAEVVGTSSATEAFLTASPVTQSLFPTKYETPSGLPAGGTMIAGFQIRMHTVTNSSGGWRVWTMDPTTAFGIPGTWSGVSGGDGANPGEFYIDGWDYWVTEYLNFGTSAASSNKVDTAPSGAVSAAGVNEINMITRCRRSDWDGGYVGNGATLIRCNALSFAYEVRFDASGLRVTAPMAGQTLTASSFTVPIATLGFTDGQWEWLQCHTVGNTTDVYTSNDGVNWNHVHTGIVAGSVFSATSGYVIVGNGSNASSYYGSGFGGDISDLYFTTDVAFDANLNLPGMGSAGDSSWSTMTTAPTTWARHSVTAIGSALGSGNPTFMFDTPIALDQFTVFMDNVNDGSYEIDEWCLDYITDDGWSVGMILAN